MKIALTMLPFVAASAVARDHQLQSSLGLAKGLAHRLLKDSKSVLHQRRRRTADADGDDGTMMCDAALAQCMGELECLKCFTDLKENEVNWASVTSGVPCEDALKAMNDDGHCTPLKSNAKAQAAFCVTFNACVKSQETKPNNPAKNSTEINCDELETCDFPGIHKQFLGDGICNDKLPGCYNTAICGYDKGDCCEDSCKLEADAADGGYCGLEGYACKDPDSLNCSSVLTSDCVVPDDKDKGGDDGQGDGVTECPDEEEELYSLFMYDSFGDGWEETEIEIKEATTKTSVFKGSLASGSVGTENICLKPICYDVKAAGGIWGKEVSWEIKPSEKEGAPAISSGGSPMECQFAVASTACELTCNGRKDEDPSADPDYKDFKEMIKCIEKSCPIQLAACTGDPACNTCYEAEDLTPQYCFGMDTFNDLVDCSLCGCTDESKMEFCMDGDGETPSGPDALCSPSQTLAGGTAIIEFGACTEFDEIAMLMIEFDDSHFGDLDMFEACAHAYAKDATHDGRTALSCMRILVNAIDGATQATKTDPIISEAVSSLAELLYHNGKNFCDCAEKANDECPLCPSFHNFKTLLYESVDACNSLDEIDCAAWSEFAIPCRTNLISEFQSQNFDDEKQCKFMHDGCGTDVPFPSFRRMDCDVNQEVTTEDWKFYQDFAGKCLGDDKGGSGPTPSPPKTPAPVPVSPSGDDKPKPKPYVPPEDRDKGKQSPTPAPIATPDNKDDPASNSTDTDTSPKKGKAGKASHFWRNLFLLALLGGGGYLYYRTWGTSLEGVAIFCGLLVRFFNSLIARLRGGRLPFSGGGAQSGYGYDSAGADTMYSGLSMESSTTFEPASLPPPPAAVGQPQGGQDSGYYI